MSVLKEKCKVVMLSTNEKAMIYKFKETEVLIISHHPNQKEEAEPQHLYILSDDEIKEGDWCIHLKYNEIHKAVHDNHFEFEKGDCKKIIATTDSSLIRVVESFKGEVIEERVPQPSQAFIKKYVKLYNEGIIINNILVEYEEILDDKSINQAMTVGMSIKDMTTVKQLKVNPKDNTITIHPVKDSWNLKEMEDIHVNVVRQGCLYEGGSWSDEHERLVRIEFNKYAKENL